MEEAHIVAICQFSVVFGLHWSLADSCRSAIWHQTFGPQIADQLWRQVCRVVPHPRIEFDDCAVYCNTVPLIAVTSHVCPFPPIRHAYVSCCCILKHFPFRQSYINSLLLSLVDRSLYSVYIMRYICVTQENFYSLGLVTVQVVCVCVHMFMRCNAV